jgi:thiosulfate/3-mercaptopyruvate sulfurtransferase
LEVWERVLIESEFFDERHGSIGCIDCHGGQEGELTKEEAHVGVTRDPSSGDAPACRLCHQDTADDHEASLHATQNGYLTMFARREGLASPSAAAMDMFDARCASCHTTCGQCHVSRPTSVGGGFLDGHLFRSAPSQTLTCTACHGSRIGDEFRGQNAGFAADVHYSRGIKCYDCHSTAEIHGDGTTPATHHESGNAPGCQDAGCHPDLSGGDGATEHQLHAGTVACQVCHSISYKNCYGCHVELDSQGLEMPSRMDFRIALNPSPTPERPWTYVLRRHVPIRPDSFTAWNVSLPEYASEPTWRVASPHNIQRSTPQNASCDACHGNAELFLTPDYIQSLVQEGTMVSEEIDANAAVVVSDLPEM